MSKILDFMSTEAEAATSIDAGFLAMEEAAQEVLAISQEAEEVSDVVVDGVNKEADLTKLGEAISQEDVGAEDIALTAGMLSGLAMGLGLSVESVSPDEMSVESVSEKIKGVANSVADAVKTAIAKLIELIKKGILAAKKYFAAIEKTGKKIAEEGKKVKGDASGKTVTIKASKTLILALAASGFPGVTTKLSKSSKMNKEVVVLSVKDKTKLTLKDVINAFSVTKEMMHKNLKDVVIKTVYIRDIDFIYQSGNGFLILDTETNATTFVSVVVKDDVEIEVASGNDIANASRDVTKTYLAAEKDVKAISSKLDAIAKDKDDTDAKAKSAKVSALKSRYLALSNSSLSNAKFQLRLLALMLKEYK